MKLLSYGVLGTCILISGVTPILFKVGMNAVGSLDTMDRLLSLRTVKLVLSNKYILAGIALYLGSSILWLIGLSMLDVSLMYPLLSLAYVVTTVLAVLVLNEPVRMSRWMGVILIILGSILTGLNR
ncbi:EamA family transporter [Thermococcus celer]|uniref:EamA domain-containing protein n=1 Tax=Thermococcus celer Vu 13 = JCM 8558 TaxID=1293037 RepID=A0A218P1I8_THECE|nr:EamA family transporter [Thermococcus celer]ASI98781.1 hypothetical protein A3L02_03985 [Thermococcus celer Vu 13 = JCM 8558]